MTRVVMAVIAVMFCASIAHAGIAEAPSLDNLALISAANTATDDADWRNQFQTIVDDTQHQLVAYLIAQTGESDRVAAINQWINNNPKRTDAIEKLAAGVNLTLSAAALNDLQALRSRGLMGEFFDELGRPLPGVTVEVGRDTVTIKAFDGRVLETVSKDDLTVGEMQRIINGVQAVLATPAGMLTVDEGRLVGDLQAAARADIAVALSSDTATTIGYNADVDGKAHLGFKRALAPEFGDIAALHELGEYIKVAFVLQNGEPVSTHITLRGANATIRDALNRLGEAVVAGLVTADQMIDRLEKELGEELSEDLKALIRYNGEQGREGRALIYGMQDLVFGELKNNAFTSKIKQLQSSQTVSTPNLLRTGRDLTEAEAVDLFKNQNIDTSGLSKEKMIKMATQSVITSQQPLQEQVRTLIQQHAAQHAGHREILREAFLQPEESAYTGILTVPSASDPASHGLVWEENNSIDWFIRDGESIPVAKDGFKQFIDSLPSEPVRGRQFGFVAQNAVHAEAIMGMLRVAGKAGHFRVVVNPTALSGILPTGVQVFVIQNTGSDLSDQVGKIGVGDVVKVEVSADDMSISGLMSASGLKARALIMAAISGNRNLVRQLEGVDARTLFSLEKLTPTQREALEVYQQRYDSYVAAMLKA